MVNPADPTTHDRHDHPPNAKTGALHDMLLTMLLFSSMGAITWAIRGSNGWGGIDGTLVPGMTWGVLWAYVCARKGIDAGLTPIFLGLGISIGGELGYGQYVSWIRGMFNVGDDVIPIAPWIGYAWFVICGIGWGATGGVALGWALTPKHTIPIWLARILLPAAVAYLAYLLVQTCPQWFFPHYDPAIYAGIHTENFDHHLQRTVYTNSQNFTALAWWVGVLLTAAFQKDRVTLVIATLIGGGFGIGFTLGALWCLGYSVAPRFIDWWKMWELNAGFNLGILYTLALYWNIRNVDRGHQYDPSVPRPSGSGPTPPSLTTSRISRKGRAAYVLTIAILLWIAFRGVSVTLGGLLNFYEIDKIGQYTWPPARTALYLPAMAALIIATACHLWPILRSPQPNLTTSHPSLHPPYRPDRLIDLMTTIALVGAISIWPAKISILYTAFLALALFAFTRLLPRPSSPSDWQPPSSTVRCPPWT